MSVQPSGYPYFNPLAPRGARPQPSPRAARSHRISIHSPRVGRDQAELQAYADRLRFQSTRPAWGETECTCVRWGAIIISIHSPRVGRDQNASDNPKWWPISIHSPRVGRDLSTISRSSSRRHFNPLAPRGARRSPVVSPVRLGLISIHSPRAGRDRRHIMSS